MGQIGQNPMAQQMQAAIMAHIAEHVAFQYRRQVEERLGVTLPAPDTEMPKEVEVQLSKLVAQAATQVLNMHKGQAAQQQAQEQMQDPIVQMQQAELQIKAQEAQTKQQKVQGDLQIRQAELQLKAQEVAQKTGEDPAIAAARAQQDMAIKQQEHEQKMRNMVQMDELKLRQQMLKTNNPAAKSPGRKGD